MRRAESARLYPKARGLPLRHLFMTELATQLSYRGPMRNWDRHLVSATTLDLELALRLPRADILHTHSNCLRMTLRWSRARRALKVCEHRALHPQDEHPLGGPLHAASLRELEEADVIILPSHKARESFQRNGIDPARCLVLPLGVDGIFYAANSTTLALRKRRVLFVGAIEPRKNLETLLRAYTYIAGGTTELHLIGPVLDRDYAQKLRSICPDVVFRGSIPRTRLSKEYRAARALVLPSASESFGLVVGEAMAAGTPVVVSTGCGVAEILNDQVNGLLFDPSDIRGLSERLGVLLSDQELDLSNALVQAGCLTALHYSWLRYRESLRRIYLQRIVPQWSTRSRM
ncbi:MAG: glycosyltransferase family 4 protein [Mycobacteriales bacterium]